MPNRERLPNDRIGRTHKFRIGDTEGFLIVGLYPDGRVGEMFLTIDKEGTALGGAYDSWARMVSVSLQYGVPLKEIVSKFLHVNCDPQGITGNQQIPIAKSVPDYVAKWLGMNYLSPDEREEIGFVVQVKE